MSISITEFAWSSLLYTTFVYEITLSSGYDIRNLLEITGIQVNIKDCKNLAEYGSYCISPLVMRWLKIFYTKRGLSFTSCVELSFSDLIFNIAQQSFN